MGGEPRFKRKLLETLTVIQRLTGLDATAAEHAGGSAHTPAWSAKGRMRHGFW
ncbi:MAG: hypothetical protein LH481_00485 [Burkholderiales bacterium]|nr:hypothetical protein [Burkholderiales bacterium]